MHDKLDTLLVLTGLTEKQADSITKYIIRQQENDRFEYCQVQKNHKSELDSTMIGVPTLRIYGMPS